MATDAGPRGRHFYASLLISRSCSVQTVQRRLGHQSAMETLDTYGHLWPDSDDETRAAVDHVLAGIDERRSRLDLCKGSPHTPSSSSHLGVLRSAPPAST